jgi:hypothetical protein
MVCRRAAEEIVTYIWNLFLRVIVSWRSVEEEVKSGGFGSTFSIGLVRFWKWVFWWTGFCAQ